MADLGTVGIAVEVRGREALRQLENDMVVVDRSAKSAARSFEAFERAGLKTAETFRYVSDAAKKRLADEQRITQELVKQRTAAEQLARANAQKFQSQIGGNLGLGAQGISAGASASAFEGEIERLRVKYDRVYASSQLYEKSLNELNQAHAFGVLSIKQHEAAVESLNLEYQNFQNGIAQAGNRFAQYTAQNAGRMNQFGVVTQQAGYQIGDFLVQVQSGTNWMVAFGQQATQLVGILPLMGAGFMGLSAGALVALSAGLGIAIPLVTAIGAAFMRTSQEADSASKGIDRQTQAYEALTERVRQLRLERQMAASGAQTESEQTVINTLNAALEERKRLLAEALALEAESTSEYSLREAAARGELAERQQINLAAIQKNEELLKELAYQQQLETAAKRRANEERNAYREAKAEADRWKAALDGIKTALDSINGMAVTVTMDLKSTASGWAANFMEQLTSGLEERAAYSAAVGAGRGLNMGGPELDPFGFRAQLERDKAKTSGSGGGRQAAIKKEIELTKELTAVEKERQTVLNGVQSSLESGFMSMVSGTDSVKDAFKKMAFSIIQELYKVLVVQRMVGSFDVATGGGSGIMGFLGGLFKREAGGTMMPGQPYLVGERGPELVIPRHSGTVVNANQTANAMCGAGSVTVQNNITVTGSDAAMVRTEIAKMIPQITNATKAAVIDAKQRGGQMAAAFR